MAIIGVSVDRELDVAATAVYAELFHALSEPTRLAIVQHLAVGEHRVRDLVEHMGLAQSTVSKHLACLRECGLVAVRVEGRASWFSLSEPDLLAGLFSGAERLLGATGEQVRLCSHLVHPMANAGGES
ncbi:ArsR/SmtB family transcription factor [Cellulosimicrobium funkei]|uniref:ArsR family transcriptional regulator n=1 Tax=Cellulosimicrobium funkei TaxID=264251 RepID=A0A4Y8QYS6_9MICO|nr:metalloregulator ArsR/SmtB family transcription factor [Cellulosimicrobium funkei]TFF04411.1 ArsR family transcriptional regulator [Cellulosimicrobium funkei]TGA67924.1 ArsR family transcriptional regulator [Cellulosimicrobium terreum]